MSKSIPAPVVVVAIVLVIAVSVFLLQRASRTPAEAAGTEPWQSSELDKLMEKSKGDLSKLTPEERDRIRQLKPAGQSMTPK